MYYGITIGPIVDTISKAQKTVEIWSVSYLFSKIMKDIVKNLYEKVEFIIPYVDKNDFDKKDNGIGMYHDRLIFKTDLSFEDINQTIKNVKLEIAKDIAFSIKADENKVNEFFEKYIKIYIASKKDCENPILEIYKILDDLELNNEVYEYENYMDRFLIRDNILKSKLLKNSGKNGFDSIPEIASVESGENFGYLEQDDDYYKKLKEKLKDNFKQVYKYIAIVHADGDNLGNVVKSLKEINQNNPISKALFNFTTESKEILEKYSCNIIYIGGDDLLFFAPVVMKVDNESKTIFDLLEELKKIYAKNFKFYNDKNETKTTLSFGVSITYYKFPLSEALQLSRDTLFSKAKSKRNTVGISVRKHSGQMNELILNFDDERYDVFKNFLNKILNNEIDIPFSIHYKLRELEELLECLENFDGFFENYFNEDIHKDKFAQGLEFVKSLIEKSPKDKRLEVAFATLNIIKLLKGRK